MATLHDLRVAKRASDKKINEHWKIWRDADGRIKPEWRTSQNAQSEWDYLIDEAKLLHTQIHENADYQKMQERRRTKYLASMAENSAKFQAKKCLKLMREIAKRTRIIEQKLEIAQSLRSEVENNA